PLRRERRSHDGREKNERRRRRVGASDLANAEKARGGWRRSGRKQLRIIGAYGQGARVADQRGRVGVPHVAARNQSAVGLCHVSKHAPDPQIAQHPSRRSGGCRPLGHCAL
ncbi:hypothetical protein H4217_008050, partial [Coemansia sp. RSA 1939]